MSGDPSDTSSSWSAPRSGASFGWESDDDGHAFDVRERDRYDDAGELGRGGMGEVRAAHDRRLGREVALKVLRVDSAAHEARLAREAEITARLEHPGIVPVYGAGRTEDGALYYTMRLVRGQSLARAFGEASGLDARLRTLRHLLDACEAVAYAASQGVVHRDLKPDNIMIGRFGETQVVDWGLAAVLRGPHARDGLGGNRVGTPQYASPQQAGGTAPDPRDDVFSLGGILFELLTGRPPRTGTRFVTDVAVPRVLELAPHAPAELAAIADRALALDPAIRYPDALALATDLEAWFDGRRVAAYDYSPRELLARLLRTWRAPLAVAALAGVALLAIGVLAFLRTAAERDRADAARHAAEAAEADAARHLARALSAQAATAAAAGRRAEAEVLAVHALAIEEMPEARGVLSGFGLQPRPQHLGRAALPECNRLFVRRDGAAAGCLTDGGVRGIDLATAQATDLLSLPDPIFAVHVRSDGVLLVGSPDRRIVIARPGEALEVLAEDLGTVEGLVEDADAGLMLAFGRGKTALLDLETGAHQLVWPCLDGLPLAADLAGGRVAAGCADGTVRVADASAMLTGGGFETARTLVTQAVALHLDRSTPGRLAVGLVSGQVVVLDGSEVIASADSGPDAARDVYVLGDRFAVASGRGDVGVWSVEAGRRIAHLPTAPASVRLLPDDRVRVITRDAVEEWQLRGAGPTTRWTHAEGLSAVSLAPHRPLLATSHGDGALRVHRIDDGGLEAALDYQSGVVKDVAFSPDGGRIAATAMGEPSIRVWRTDDWELQSVHTGLRNRRVAWVDDARVLGLPYSFHPRMWDTVDQGPEQRVGDTPWPYFDGERSTAGPLWLADHAGGIWRLPPDPTPRMTRIGGLPGIDCVTGHDTFALAARDGRLYRIDVDEPPRALGVAAARVVDLDVSPDGALFAAARLDGLVDIRRTADGTVVAVLRGHLTRASTVDFAADGRLLASGSWDATARLWDAEVWFTDPVALRSTIESAWGRTLEDFLPE